MRRPCTVQPLLAPAQAALTASSSETFAGPNMDHLRAETGCGMLVRLIEVFAVAARACAAVGYYEELNRLSDDELASRGLRRADVSRAAFQFLADD